MGVMKQDWQEDLVFSSQSKRRGFGSTSSPEKSIDVRIRVRLIWGVFVMGIAFILAKIIYLQGVEGEQYKLISYANHVEVKKELAPRGIVYDRNGVALVENINIEGKLTRKYPLGEAIASILGYISEVKKDELGCEEGLCYSPGMMIGRAGLEKMKESTLRGTDGGKLAEVDSAGREIRELGKNLPENGRDVQLSVDSRLQKIMYEAMSLRKGSAVAIDMQGKVMGLVSSPSYDPTHIEDYLADNEMFYFLNRPIAATYPPGSVYKLVTALAGLSEDKILAETEYDDTGEIKVGIYRYGNWYFDQYGRTEGKINLTRALGRSNDIYFYKVGEELGIDNLVKWSRKFGLGEKTGIELPGEQSGLVPDQLWKERVTGEKWFLGNTYHMSIGQGDLLVTPVQVARMTLGAISGRLCQISLFKDSAVMCSDIGLKTENIALVREGMKEACAPGGTAFPFFESEPWVLCKTGTAQHSGQIKEEDLPHAWITVAYPGENPEIIVTVMLESAGEGSAEAGPVAKTIIDGWKGVRK